MMSPRGPALLLSALLAGGCVTVRWQRQLGNEHISAAQVEAVRADGSDLAHAMGELGAPLFVWELPQGSFALAYGWLRDRGLGGTVTVPLSRAWSPSYTYADVDANLYGLVLIFDYRTRLQMVREGYLTELAAELRGQRPADVEDLGPPLDDGDE
jgi:hypothetical protein